MTDEYRSGRVAADEDLSGDGAAEGAIATGDHDDERSVEGMLLPDLDADTGADAEGVEERDELGIGNP